MAGHQVSYTSGLPVVLTSVDKPIQWGRSNSLWALSYKLACCAIEVMVAGGSGYDFSRFGATFRVSPRRSEVMIIVGTLCKKHAEFTRRLYDQMPDPRWVISMGNYANTGGMFNTYSTVQGVDRTISVDAYIPGCAPCSESFQLALVILQRKIRREKASRRIAPKRLV